RTPLSGIKAVSEALDEGVITDTGEVRRYAVEMRLAVDSLIKMVDDLFDLVQADAGQVASPRSVPLGSAVGSAIGACAVAAQDKGVSLRTELDGAAEVECSPRLERVLQNLLVNAVRHTSEGEVVVRGHVEEGGLVIEVTDTGE